MNPSYFFFSDSAKLERYLKSQEKRDYEWCYFGINIVEKNKIEKKLGRDKEISFSLELNQTALELKEPFLNWIAQIGKAQANPIAWWSSILATKSTLQSDFFLLLCYFRMVLNWLERNEIRKNQILIVVEDPWLLDDLRKQLSSDARCLFFRNWVGLSKSNIYWGFRSILIRGYVLIWGGLAYISNFLLGFTSEVSDRKEVILLYTWIEERCFQQKDDFTDANLGRLSQIISSDSFRVMRFTPLEIPIRFLKKLKRFSDFFVLTSSFLRIKDVLRTAFQSYKVQKINLYKNFEGMECYSLLSREAKMEQGKPSQRKTILWYLTLERWFLKKNHGIKCIVYPYENHSWEKLLCLAVKRSQTKIRLVGYQHSSIPPLLLCYFFSPDDLKNMPIPDYIVTNGQSNLNLLESAGYPKHILVNGGALRYEYLHKKKLNRDNLSLDEPLQKTVLVTFPLSRPYALDLFLEILKEINEPIEIDKIRVKFLLKFHPWLPLENITSQKFDLPEWLELSKAPLGSVLNSTSLLLYTPSTASWWEAYLSGVPVLKYMPKLLDIDTCDADPSIRIVKCSKHNLRSSIIDILSSPSQKRVDDREELKKTMFGKVEEAVWQDITR